MSVLDFLNPASGVISLIGSIVNKVVPDKNQAEKDALILELTKDEEFNKILLAQAATNTAEAENGKWYDDWRDLVGWVCGCSFAWAYMLQPMITYFITISGHQLPPLPQINTSELMPLLLAMLGIGGMKSFDNKGSK